MKKEFLTYIQKEGLFHSGERILLAVSGGIDSTVLCSLFHSAELLFAIAHCNFQLRGKESDGDEHFVKELSGRYKVPFHTTCFDTDAYAKKNKLSTQVAARELRYTWFEKIRTEYNYAFIATAHHQNDIIETFFINLIRGTGISGLRSIVPKQGKIIRPILFAAKKDIQAYAEKNKISYREDSSNASDHYLRNRIRHHLLPVLHEFSPVAESSILHSIERLREAEFIYKQAINEVRSNICDEQNGTIRISITALQKLNSVSTYLYELLKPYGFNAATTADIVSLLTGESGKQFYSSTHRLIKDRNFLILEPIVKSNEQEEYQVEKDQTEIAISTLRLTFQKTEITKVPVVPTTSDSATIDLNKLEFPLTIRKWKTGDTFYPLGMKGKKKLSDFFIDRKRTLIEKENTWLVCSGGKIVWVIGMRLDDRFKIEEKTKNMLVIRIV